MQGDSPSLGEGDIEAWVNGAAGHYGRKRRVDILRNARTLVLADRKRGGEEDALRVEMQTPQPSSISILPDVMAIQGDGSVEAKTNENDWDFDDAEPNLPEANGHSHCAANGNAIPTDNHELEAPKVSGDASEWDFDEGPSNRPEIVVETTEDDSDAWGWGDDNDNSVVNDIPTDDNVKEQTNGHTKNGTESTTSDDSAWDDTWDEPASQPIPPTPQKQPKAAKGLEKLSKKGQKSVASPTLSSNSPLSAFAQSPTFPSSASTASSHTLASPRPDSLSPQDWNHTHSPSSPPASRVPPPPLVQRPPEPEIYAVSGRAQALIQLVTDVIEESQETSNSKDLANLPSSSNPAGSSTNTLLLQAASSTLDLYCAIFPVSFSPELQRSDRAFRFSNDCTYIKSELSKYVASTEQAREAMHESLERLDGLAERWFDTGVVSYIPDIKQLLHAYSLLMTDF